MPNHYRLIDLINDPELGAELCTRLNQWTAANRLTDQPQLRQHTLIDPARWEADRSNRARVTKSGGKRNVDLEQTDPELYRDLMAAIDWDRVRASGLLTEKGTITMTTSRERQKEAVRKTRNRLNEALHAERKALGFTSMPSKEERARVLHQPAEVSVTASVVHRKQLVLASGLRLLLTTGSGGSQSAVAEHIGMSVSGVNNVLRGYVVWSWDQFQPLIAAVAKVLSLPEQDVYAKAMGLGALVFAEPSKINLEVSDVPVAPNAAVAATDPGAHAGAEPAPAS